jgi:hypothetical protein
MPFYTGRKQEEGESKKRVRKRSRVRALYDSGKPAVSLRLVSE